jgi:hypothetical protein
MAAAGLAGYLDQVARVPQELRTVLEQIRQIDDATEGERARHGFPRLISSTLLMLG